MTTLTTSYQQLAQASIGTDSYGHPTYIRVYAKADEPDYANRRTLVYYQARAYHSEGCYIQDGLGTGSVWGTGASTENGSCSGQVKGEVVIATASGYVDHDEDGNASVSCGASLKFPSWGSSWNATASATATLPSIPAVQTSFPPNPPTLKGPASGAVFDSSGDSVEFKWAHNPTDGSSQTAAQLQHSTNGGSSWTTVNVSGDVQSKSVSMFLVNSTVTWRVRTKGENENYGDWSETRVFYVKAAPTVSISEPSNGSTATQMPLTVRLSYQDLSGVLAASTLVVERNGETVYSRNMGTETEASIKASEWLPENGASYTLRVEARSSSTLTARAESVVSFEFVPPMKGTATVTPDPETGYARIEVSVVRDSSLDDVASLSVLRVTENGSALVKEGLKDGDEVVDRYAPLNTHYAYDIVSFSDEGAISTNRIEAPVIASKWWFFYFGDGDMARALWNPAGSISLTRPQDEDVHYWGRALPVSYTGTAVDETRQFSATLETKDMETAFRRLLESGGKAVYKSADGDVMHVKETHSVKPAYTASGYYGTVTVKMRRIDGEVL